MKIEYKKTGRQRTVNAKIGKILVDRGLAHAVEAGENTSTSQTYQTRMMQAAKPVPTVVVDPAPYGYKADGTPRKRPGRPPVSA